MRNLGEQWVEDGHMWKVVPNGSCDGCDFNLGCMRNGGVICRSGHCATKQGHVKDLGLVNEDGCLASPWDSSLFPRLEFQKNVGRHNKESGFIRIVPCIWYAVVDPKDGVLVCTPEYQTKQQAIDAWNWRI